MLCERLSTIEEHIRDFQDATGYGERMKLGTLNNRLLGFPNLIIRQSEYRNGTLLHSGLLSHDVDSEFQICLKLKMQSDPDVFRSPTLLVDTFGDLIGEKARELLNSGRDHVHPLDVGITDAERPDVLAEAYHRQTQSIEYPPGFRVNYICDEVDTHTFLVVNRKGTGMTLEHAIQAAFKSITVLNDSVRNVKAVQIRHLDKDKNDADAYLGLLRMISQRTGGLSARMFGGYSMVMGSAFATQIEDYRRTYVI